MRKWIGGFSVLLLMVLIIGCSHSIEDEQKKAIKNAEQVFNNKKEDVNDESKEIKFYLPYGMSIKDELQNNVILEKGGNDYILFYNQNESKDSQVVYKMSRPEKGIIVDKTFNKKNQFGYLIISKVNKETYEVTVGVGGVKITTESKIKKIADNTEIMMKILKSVQKKK
ncbi:hypothetical protein ACQKP0_17390 [Heyndrickxia sp. NPDC080065]|uniref:hypothetical protein n=1 Tax=Heyndrickxia sp. NPDC080065 TaxID=3390568 RepID=UPI003CFE166B